MLDQLWQVIALVVVIAVIGVGLVVGLAPWPARQGALAPAHDAAQRSAGRRPPGGRQPRWRRRRHEARPAGHDLSRRRGTGAAGAGRTGDTGIREAGKRSWAARAVARSACSQQLGHRQGPARPAVPRRSRREPLGGGRGHAARRRPRRRGHDRTGRRCAPRSRSRAPPTRPGAGLAARRPAALVDPSMDRRVASRASRGPALRSSWSSVSTAPARRPRSASWPACWSPRTRTSCSARPTPSARPPPTSWQTWGDRVGVPTIRSDREGADPAAVAFDAVKAGGRDRGRCRPHRHRRPPAQQDQPHGRARQGQARHREAVPDRRGAPRPRRHHRPERPAQAECLPRSSTSPASSSPSSTAPPRAASSSPSSATRASRSSSSASAKARTTWRPSTRCVRRRAVGLSAALVAPHGGWGATRHTAAVCRVAPET
jgi:hypothetical protein